MIRILQKKSLVALTIFGILFSGIQVAQAAGTNATTDRYIISFSNDDDVEGESNEFRNQGIKIHATFKAGFKGLVGDFTQAQINDLKKNPKFLYAEKDARVYASAITGTPTNQTGATWGLDRINQRSLPTDGSYSYTSNGAGVTAYVIDTGILSTHSEFGVRVQRGFKAPLVLDGNGTEDCNGHGTHVSGTIGGTTHGVAKAVSLVPVRVLDCTGSGFNSDVIAGIDWAVTDHQAGTPAVANLSLGGGFSQALNDAIQRLIADGVTVAVAAGNSNADACASSPSSATNAITVGATGSNDARASFSNYGLCVDIFAPGVNITSSVIGSNTATALYSGTSMASPHVAGAAALLLEVNQTATPLQIRDLLVTSSTCGKVTTPGSGSPTNLLVTAPAVSEAAPAATPACLTGLTVSGSPQVGTLLTANFSSRGTAPITYTYQWQVASTLNGTYSNIALATGSTYTPVLADVGKYLRVTAGARNAIATSATVTSASVLVPTPPTPPTISSVTISTNPRVGTAVIATVTTSGTTPITLSYQWQISATAAGTFTNIGSATTSSYTPVVADQGKFLKVVVGASNGAGAATPVTSAVSTAIQLAPVITAVTISSPGAFAVNSILTANATATGLPAPTFTYQWQSATTLNGTYNNIANQTARTYTLPTTMRNQFIRVQVRAVNAVATTAAFNSSGVGPIT